MSFENILRDLLADQLAPVLAELRQVRAELDRLRRALPSQLVSATAAARVLGVNARTVRRRIQDGTLPSRRVGKRLLVDLASVTHAPTEEEVNQVAAQIMRRG